MHERHVLRLRLLGPAHVEAGDPAEPVDLAAHKGDAPDHVLALYSEHLDSARALACRLLYDPAEAEDVVHDVFLTLFRRPDCFDPTRGTARSWLLTVVRNRSLDRLRRRCHMSGKDLSGMEDRLEDPWCADVLDELTTAARSQMLWQLVDGLPPCQADLIRRAFISRQTHQEIADATGLPLGTVKSRIRLGLDKLRAGMRSATLAEVAD